MPVNINDRDGTDAKDTGQQLFCGQYLWGIIFFPTWWHDTFFFSKDIILLLVRMILFCLTEVIVSVPFSTQSLFVLQNGPNVLVKKKDGANRYCVDY